MTSWHTGVGAAHLRLGVALLLLTAGCTSSEPVAPAEPRSSAAASATGPAAVAAPEVGACRVLEPDAVEEPDDDSPTVPCGRRHTAETFAVGRFDGALTAADVDDERLGEEVLGVCERRFRRYVGADDSLALRTVLTWAWFRPTPAAWEAGARWYRCDVLVPGAEGLRGLRGRVADVLLGRPDDRWLLCAVGSRVVDAVRVACDEPHDWRAVTTVVVDDARAPWPGAQRVEVRSRDFCSDSVGAWLGYPVDYPYGYTWPGRAEWQAGTRRSVCWARTSR